MTGDLPEIPAENNFRRFRAACKSFVASILRPRVFLPLWQWLEKHAVIPIESGSPNPGPLRFDRFPIFRGLHDLAQRPGVHYFTLCASARVGKTLFSVCIVLYWLVEKFGQIVWLEPTRQSARRLVRAELDAFLLGCQPVRALAICPPPEPGSKFHWTTLEKAFRGKTFRIVPSGAEADLHGFQAELAVINEADRCRQSIDRDAASEDKIIARTRQFAHTRLILRNSTPGEHGELGSIWQHFLKGSQHYCYVPCPHCSSMGGRGSAEPGQSTTTALRPEEGAKSDIYRGPLTKEGAAPTGSAEASPSQSPGGSARVSVEADALHQNAPPESLAGWQRLTFFPETKLVPFDVSGAPLPLGQTVEEKTGYIRFEQFAIFEDRPCVEDATKIEKVKVGYDIDAVEKGATYCCAHCGRDIDWTDINWMLDRFQWRAHNPRAASDHISAHVSALYSPFEFWGIIAKEFLEAKGNLGRLMKFWTLTLGLPFIRHRSAITEDDLDRVIKRTPVRYLQGQLPMEPEFLTLAVDVQAEQFWYTIRAWGILWDHPDRPTWSALVDWGECVSWEQIEEIAGLRERRDGTLRRFKWDGTASQQDGRASLPASQAGTQAQQELRPPAVREYIISAGLIDSGHEAKENKNVYEFCAKWRELFSPYKGGDQSKTRGDTVRLSPIMHGTLDLVWAWSDFFAAALYYNCLRDGRNGLGDLVHWWLPINLDGHYRQQLTAERQVEEHSKMVWKAFGPNHLGDCEKMQEVGRDKIEERLEQIRVERLAEEDKD